MNAPQGGHLPRCRRRHRQRWTPAEDALLLREWGELSSRVLRERLGRTGMAILARAKDLGLPPASARAAPLSEAGRRLGISGITAQRFAESCGIRLDRRACCVVRETCSVLRLGCDVDQLEALYAQRVRRVLSVGEWCRSRGRDQSTQGRRLRAAGIASQRGARLRALYPEALLDEVSHHGRRGRWVTLWRAIQGLDRLPCEPWLLALAAVDIAAAGRAPEGAAGDAARAAAEWTEHLPQGPLTLATRLAVESVIP